MMSEWHLRLHTETPFTKNLYALPGLVYVMEYAAFFLLILLLPLRLYCHLFLLETGENETTVVTCCVIAFDFLV